MRKLLILCALGLGFSGSAIAQDDLLGDLEKEANAEKQFTKSTFKATRLINGHTVENMGKKQLDFRIAHRFGRLNEGAYNLWGLDNAQVRISFEYGITDDLMVGVGRSSYQKTYDGFLKYKLIKQVDGGKGIPISVSLFGSTAINTLEKTFANPAYEWSFDNRLSYCSQVLIARKFNSSISLQISPTYIHRNIVATKKDQNGVFAVGVGGRVKITKRTSFNAEYFYQLPGHNADNFNNVLSFGFDIETGGHVFQLHFTNSRSMVEQQFIADTKGDWGKGDVFYGFNISRTFSLK